MSSTDVIWSAAMSRLVLFLAVICAVGLGACKKTKEGAMSSTSGQGKSAADGLVIEEVQAGTGEVATKGKNVSVHYTGTLTNGTKFDSSLDRGQPIQFPLGTGWSSRAGTWGSRG